MAQKAPPPAMGTDFPGHSVNTWIKWLVTTLSRSFPFVGLCQIQLYRKGLRVSRKQAVETEKLGRFQSFAITSRVSLNGTSMEKFVDKVLKLDKNVNSAVLARAIDDIILHHDRGELVFSIYLLLSKMEILSAFLVSLWLRRSGSNSAGISFALAIGGFVYNVPMAEKKGMAELLPSVGTLTPAQQEEFYKGVVYPVTTHLLKGIFTDHVRLVKLVEILKSSAPHLRRRVVTSMKFEVATACQFDCAECAHGEMRSATKKYQMTLEQVKKFIYFTEKSNYYIERLQIHGPGEPFLWKYFDDAMLLLSQSKSIGKIEITTNGMALDRIQDSTWDLIDVVDVSVYAEAQSLNLQDALSKHKDKLRLNKMDGFIRRVRAEEVPIRIPCGCLCSGPMVFGDFVFLSCGPPMFEAAAFTGKDVFSLKELCVDLSENYLDTFDIRKIGNMELCQYCWANGGRVVEKVKQNISGGGWQ